MKSKYLGPLVSLRCTFDEILRRRGTDLDEVLSALVRRQKALLRDPSSEREFEEIFEHGCEPQMLAALLLFIRRSQDISVWWTLVIGDRKSRKALAKTLEEASLALETHFPAVAYDAREELTEKFEDLGRIPMSKMIAELRLYVRLLRLAEFFKIQIET